MSTGADLGPTRSPDGRWVWDGSAWRPAPPHLSADGEWRWTGRYWEPSPRRGRVTLLMWFAAVAAGVALFALNGLVIYAADVPAGARAEGALSIWVGLAVLDAPAVVLGALAAVLARGRSEARLVGLLSVAGGLIAAAVGVAILSIT